MLLSIDGSGRVNDIERREFSPGGDQGLASRQSFRNAFATNLATLCEDLRPARPVNCSVDSASTEQRRIGRVHNCLDILFSDVADNHIDAAAEKRLFGFRVQALA